LQYHPIPNRIDFAVRCDFCCGKETVVEVDVVKAGDGGVEAAAVAEDAVLDWSVALP